MTAGLKGHRRIAYASRFGAAVLPVNYKWHDGAVVFRTTRHSALDEDLQTWIAGGDYLVAFEIDQIDEPRRQGWSVLIQGPAPPRGSRGRTPGRRTRRRPRP
jgi:nitroimidazol reductase NimA-like FMN-containing flavoprotein (pyridoxamine 5'-phosphate oxidase superfamily)